MIKLAFSNTKNLGNVYFAGGFNSWLYLNATEYLPVSEIEEEGNEDSQGNFFMTFQRVKLVYKVEVYVLKHIAEAFAFLPLYDQVEITDNSGNWGIMDNIKISSQNIEFNCVTKLTVEYTLKDQDVIKTSC